MLLFWRKKVTKKHDENQVAPSAYGGLGLLLAAAERLWLAFLAMFDLPSVAQRDISVVGCVADATGVYGWLVDAGLWGGGRRWICKAAGAGQTPVLAQATDYYPFGKSFEQNNVDKNRYLYNGKELQDQVIGGTPFGWYDYGARFYDPEIARWHSMDPLAEDYASWTGYHYVHNNPINLIDPNGMNASTHTDSLGNVVAVYNDGDLGVYKHNGNKDEAKKEAEENHNDQNTSAGGEKMGETEYWDEFMHHNPHTGEPTKEGGRIYFDESWDSDIKKLNKEVIEKYGLEITALKSIPNGKFDIKKNKNYAPSGPLTGKKLNGKYASAESAGNYLAGLNGATGVSVFGYTTWHAFMKMAGLLHAYSNHTDPSKPPYYGEIPYAGRRCLEGFVIGLYKRKKGL